MGITRRELNGEPAPRGRNPARMVGESYRDCVDRLAGELRAAQIDRDAACAEIARLKAELELERSRYTLGGVPPGYRPWGNVKLPPPPSAESGRFDGS